ncbi:hypothetical protein SCP_0205050 [Sparassis crispa]|uniref:Uncharacterized protein n=1 Tax=Sparassis crispa TaxID=139825 RepID=A0A401GAX8_9APHY|nr:hypothetical protein SCP_0205050 [Sparassis crispa]GBE79307.1 hypothetical protein SCP_0205050 [Sparassis crispa]
MSKAGGLGEPGEVHMRLDASARGTQVDDDGRSARRRDGRSRSAGAMPDMAGIERRGDWGGRWGAARARGEELSTDCGVEVTSCRRVAGGIAGGRRARWRGFDAERKDSAQVWDWKMRSFSELRRIAGPEGPEELRSLKAGEAYLRVEAGAGVEGPRKQLGVRTPWNGGSQWRVDGGRVPRIVRSESRSS